MRDSFFIAKSKYQVLDALEFSSLEYTAFVIGLFMDYYTAPYVKSTLTAQPLFIDVANNAAGIPGTGDVPCQFVYSLDIAQFVVASLALPQWEKKSYIIGDRITWNEFVSILENAKGIKFDIVHDSPSSLSAGEITELPGYTGLYRFIPKDVFKHIMSVNGLMFHEGAFDFKPSRSVNDVFPHIKVKTVKELVMEAWRRPL